MRFLWLVFILSLVGCSTASKHPEPIPEMPQHKACHGQTASPKPAWVTSNATLPGKYSVVASAPRDTKRQQAINDAQTNARAMLAKQISTEISVKTIQRIQVIGQRESEQVKRETERLLQEQSGVKRLENTRLERDWLDVLACEQYVQVSIPSQQVQTLQAQAAETALLNQALAKYQAAEKQNAPIKHRKQAIDSAIRILDKLDFHLLPRQHDKKLLKQQFTQLHASLDASLHPLQVYVFGSERLDKQGQEVLFKQLALQFPRIPIETAHCATANCIQQARAAGASELVIITMKTEQHGISFHHDLIIETEKFATATGQRLVNPVPAKQAHLIFGSADTDWSTAVERLFAQKPLQKQLTSLARCNMSC